MTLLTSTASADRSAALRFELEWDAPQACLDRDAARRAIQKALGTTHAANASAAVVRVKITETENGRFGADIWMYDATGSGERSFEGSSCMQVAQAVALIVAFALDGADANAMSAQPPLQTAERDVTLDADADANHRVQFALGVRLAGDIGSLPQADAGIALALEARFGRVSVEAAASAWLPRSAYTGPIAGSGGEFGLYTGALRGCFELLPASHAAWNLGPCAGAEAGITTGSGIGISPRRSQRVFWGAGLFGFSLRYLVAPPFALGMLAEFGVPAHRAAWRIDNFGPVFQASRVIARASLSLSWRFH